MYSNYEATVLQVKILFQSYFWNLLTTPLVLIFSTKKEKMGSCSSKSNPEGKTNNQIDSDQKYAKQNELQKIKLLLLGAGESGKSAIFKQIKLLYGARPSGTELAFWKQVIKWLVSLHSFCQVIESNVIEAMNTLCMSVEPLGLSHLVRAVGSYQFQSLSCVFIL